MYEYRYENLKRIIGTNKGKKIYDTIEKEYAEKYKNKPYSPLKYSDYKLIYIDGNRNKYESSYFALRKKFALLQILALKDEYLSELEDVLAEWCNQFTWVLPAHNVNKDNSFDYTQIDLFSAEMGFYLSETVYVFKDKLSVDIKNRIKTSLKSKIVDNFESRHFAFEDVINNWASVCACGVGLTYLYMFPERFDKVKDRIFSCMNNYLKGINESGATTEGISYWHYGFGFFAIFYDVYTQLKGEIPETLKNPKIKKTLKFIRETNFGNGIFLPFADGGSESFYYSASYAYTLKNLFKNDFILSDYRLLNSSEVLDFRVLNGADKFDDEKLEIEEKTVYYEDTQWFISKNKNYAFVAKCGNNNEMHNHNDVGCFELVKNGKKIIPDFGAGEYTYGYFNDPTYRYGKEAFVCGSWSHSVPIVNGQPQQHYLNPYGELYSGKVLSVSDNSFKLDIAGAYNVGVDSLIIEYKLNEDFVEIEYNACGLLKNITFRFVVEIKPDKVDGGVNIDGVKLVSLSGIIPEIEKVRYKNHNGVEREAYTVDFSVNKSGDVKETFKIELN